MRAVLPALLGLAVLAAGCGSAPKAAPARASHHAVDLGRQKYRVPGPAAVSEAAPVHYRGEVVILMYHGLGPVAHGDIITPKAFAGEIAALQQQGFNFVSLAQVAAFLAGSGTLPPNAVALTFDDGLESVYTYAYPVLNAHKAPFATFLIVNRVSRFPGDLSWAQVKGMEQSGLITVGSHTLASHGTVPTGPGRAGPALTSLIYDPRTGRTETQAQFTARVSADLLHARQILQVETGQPILWFAYPFGSYDQAVERILRSEGYRYAVLAEWGWGVTRSALPLELPRVNTGTPKTTPENIVSTVEYVAALTAKDPTATPPPAYVPSW